MRALFAKPDGERPFPLISFLFDYNVALPLGVGM